MNRNEGTGILPTSWWLISTALSIAGLSVSIYSFYHHLETKAHGHTDALCNISATVNCDAVASSSYSELLGLPVPLLGMMYFVTLLCLLLGCRFLRRPSFFLVYSLFLGAGTLASISLGYILFAMIGVTCISCISIYTIIFLLTGTSISFHKNHPDWRNDLSPSALAQAFSPAVLVAMIGISVFVFTQDSAETGPTATNATRSENIQSQALSWSEKEFDIPLSLNRYVGWGEDYRKGSDSAPVRIVVFSDFQCPACKQIHFTLQRIQKRFSPERVQVVFKNYPLDRACNPSIQREFHRYACRLATLARCAGQGDSFWVLHDSIFSLRSQLSDNRIISLAEQAGLSQEQQKSCLKDEGIRRKIEDDINLGNKVNVTGTPTIFVNGHKLLGGGENTLQQRVSELLQQSSGSRY